MYLFLNPTHHQFFTLALIDKNGQILVYKKINAKYQQSEKLLTEIESLMENVKCKMVKVKGIIVVKGPGGFTSLRIGLATANALAWSLQIPIVGIVFRGDVIPRSKATRDPVTTADAHLIKLGLTKLKKTKNFKPVLPKYGSEPHITLKKK